MISNFYSVFIVHFFILSFAAAGSMVDLQSVGASTSLSAKGAICSVLDYGGVADGKTDIGPAIAKAFASCALKGGATIYIPPGSYSLATGVTLNAGKSFAIQIDGLITLTPNGSFAGNALVIKNAYDVEVFSSNGMGAIDGQGYIARKTSSGQNARLIRFINSSHVSIHDILLVDSPTFHLVFNGVSNLHAFQLTIRGPNIGGSDGIDLGCTDNCYLHHIQVTNRDECISVKSPSQNVLIEDMFCNHSGGMSIGSLTANGILPGEEAAVSNITMRNINSYRCTNMLMIKTWPGGSGPVGYLKDSLFENFWAYDTTYALDIDQYWESRTTPDTGAVQISGLTFNNWTGTVDNGIQRGPIVIRGSDVVPLTDITLSNFDMWTVNGGKVLHQCKNVYGSGYCAAKSTGPSLTTFTTTMTVTSPPAGYAPTAKPDWAVEGFGVTDPIPVYTPVALWAPVSPLGALKVNAGAPTTAKASSSTSSTKLATSTGSNSISILSFTSSRLSLETTNKSTMPNLTSTTSFSISESMKTFSTSHYYSSLSSHLPSSLRATSSPMHIISPAPSADSSIPSIVYQSSTEEVVITSTIAVIPIPASSSAISNSAVPSKFLTASVSASSSAALISVMTSQAPTVTAIATLVSTATSLGSYVPTTTSITSVAAATPVAATKPIPAGTTLADLLAWFQEWFSSHT